MSEKYANIELKALCDYVITSNEGKLSIIGVFDKVFSQSFPAVHPKMFVVLKAMLKGKFLFHTKIVDKNNETIAETKPQEVGQSMSEMNANLILEFQTIVFKDPGEFALEIFFDNEKKDEIKFIVEKLN